MIKVQNRRQLLLYGALACIACLYFGEWLLSGVLSAPLEERQARIERLEKDIASREKKLSEARKTARQVDVWEKQSLPSDTEVARSLYQAWLLDLVGQAGFTSPNVDSSEPSSRKGLYSLLTFSVRGRGTLADLTHFLFVFYRAPHLHQIRAINLTPVGNEGELDVALTLEAASLPRAAQDDQLASGDSERLLFESLDPYLLIAQRNVFGTGGGFDPSEHAVLTAITRVDGTPQAWFTLRQTDELRKLMPGEVLRFGRMEAEVVRVAEADVLLSAKGEYWLLAIGESLAQAVAIPEELVLKTVPGAAPVIATRPH